MSIYHDVENEARAYADNDPYIDTPDAEECAPVRVTRSAYLRMCKRYGLTPNSYTGLPIDPNDNPPF